MLTTNAGVTTTYFVGNHYEVTNGVVTKYYFAGATRIAMRENGVLSYLISDHLGSTSLVTDASGAVISNTKYKAWGETRYSSGSNPSEYTYTGQYSYTSDFGLMYYGARWYDSSLSRFAQADSIIPAGVQGYDRYAYTFNNPINYIDPSGHVPVDCLEDRYCRGNNGGDSSGSGIRIGFGLITNGGSGDVVYGKGGLGTVVGDQHTIITATHIYENALSEANRQDLNLYLEFNGVWNEYDLDALELTIDGDVLTITLSEDLPSEFVPATPATNYEIERGQSVETTYQDESGIHIIDTTVFPIYTTIPDPYGTMYAYWNPNRTLNEGDSGGGVYYNGQFIGVNSSVITFSLTNPQTWLPLLKVAPYR